MQSVNLVSPPRNRYLSPFRQKCWVVAFFLGQLTDLVGEIKSINEIVERVNPLNPRHFIYFNLLPTTVGL
jgi:hypothetical protein